MTVTVNTIILGDPIGAIVYDEEGNEVLDETKRDYGHVEPDDMFLADQFFQGGGFADATHIWHGRIEMEPVRHNGAVVGAAAEAQKKIKETLNP